MNTNQRTRLMNAIPLIVAIALAGCSQQGPGLAESDTASEASVVSAAPAPQTIAANQYDTVFRSAVQTLRDLRFTVDRSDHRFGIVTTKPLVASSVFEPWYQDNATAQHAWASTINLRRRTVRVQLEPVSESEPTAYRLGVHVLIEQRQDPTRQLYTSVVRGTSIVRSSENRYTFRSERGVESAYWREIGTDPELESRLTRQILDHATGASASTVSASPPTAAPGDDPA